ncbi:GNAT family N-acetyltransferase [Halobacteriales archaeon QH_10_67_13]|nr:MAG: GNAT family N-acetyltransferase [Halobacteriales archaeon QH_10_67_13]
MFPELIETDRLRLERFDEALTPRLLYRRASARHSETIAEEARYVTWSPHDHLEESASVIQTFRDRWESRKSATYAVVPDADQPDSGAFAGNAGLSFDWDRQTATLGIWLRKPFWGRRYSGERAVALATVAFERLDLEVVATAVVPANEKSLRAVERYVDRLGGRREGRLRNHVATDDGTVHDAIRFSIAREEFAARDLEARVDTSEKLERSAIDPGPSATD